MSAAQPSFYVRLLAAVNNSADVHGALDSLCDEFTEALGDGAYNFFLFGMRKTVQSNDESAIKAFADCCDTLMAAERKKRA